ncbi:hypothetical protein K438DRAFT_1766998 [Mycena galopus ATCC 62051]|nr:hypothetical protein K438DRAFT_1766998 [Mycena galopus ATCC 62051]
MPPTLGLLDMEPILPVYAPPWVEPLPVTTIMPDKDAAVELLNNLLADQEFESSTWFTDGSLLEGKAVGAAIRLERGRQCEEILIPLGDGQVMEGEVEGLRQRKGLSQRDIIVFWLSRNPRPGSRASSQQLRVRDSSG